MVKSLEEVRTSAWSSTEGVRHMEALRARQLPVVIDYR